MEIKDNGIRKILEKTKNYRKKLTSSVDCFYKDINENECANDLIQNIFDEHKNEFKPEDKNNVFIECKISKQEASNGCTKKIKYNAISENGKKHKNTLDVKIPQGIENNQKIIFFNQGNFIESKEKRSNVVITINIK